LVALLWLRAVQHSQFLIFGPAAAFLHLSPGWNQLYLPINALILLGMINAGVTLIRPDWVRFHWLLSILGGVGNLIVACFLVTRGNPVVMASLGKTPDAQRVAEIVNRSIYYGIWFAVIILILQLAKDVRRLISSQHIGTPAPAKPVQ